MLHRRLLEALDSSAPLLLLFDAHRFPAEAEGVHALLRTVLRHRLAAVLPDVDLSGTPPSSAAESEVLALRGWGGSSTPCTTPCSSATARR